MSFLVWKYNICFKNERLEDMAAGGEEATSQGALSFLEGLLSPGTLPERDTTLRSADSRCELAPLSFGGRTRTQTILVQTSHWDILWVAGQSQKPVNMIGIKQEHFLPPK